QQRALQQHQRQAGAHRAGQFWRLPGRSHRHRPRNSRAHCRQQCASRRGWRARRAAGRAGDLQRDFCRDRKKDPRAADRSRAIKGDMRTRTAVYLQRGPHLYQEGAKPMAGEVKTLENRALKTEMERAEIQGTSLQVSRVALGTWAIGGWMWGGTDEA